MRPAGMALAANESLPITDKISLFLHFLRLMSALVSISSSHNFSLGTRIVCESVSISMPKKVIRVVGPTHFSVLILMPRWEHTDFDVSSVCLQQLLLAGPANK